MYPLVVYVFCAIFLCVTVWSAEGLSRRSLLDDPNDGVQVSVNISDTYKNKELADKKASKKNRSKTKVTRKKVAKKNVEKSKDGIFSLSDLPKKYDGWNLLLVQTRGYEAPVCELKSDSVFMFDGVSDTNVEFLINSQRLSIHTDSSIDSVFDDVGLRFGINKIVPFDHVEQDTNVVFDFSYQLTRDLLSQHKDFSLNLAFWPLTKSNQKNTLKIQSNDLKKAIDELSQCEEMLTNEA